MSARISHVPYDARPPGFLGARRARFAPSTAGGFHTLGWTLTASGTATTPALATTSVRTQLRRTRFTAGVTQTAGLRSASQVCWRGTDGSPPSGRGGFCFSVRFCLEFLSSRRAFIGVAMTSTPVVDAGNPSTLSNLFGVGCDDSDTTWSVIRGDATPAGKITIPGATINSDVLDVTVFCAPNSTEMHVYVSNVSTGNVLFRGKYSDKLPDGASLLHTHAHVRASNNPSIEVVSSWLEIPDGALEVPSVQGRNGVFDVRAFGAKADGVTSDSAAFRAALDAMGTVDTQSDREATLYIPPGTYALGADLLLERAVRVKGASRDRSRLVFGPYKGVRIFSATNSPSGMGDGVNVAIEDVTIALDESVLPNLPNWAPGAPYGAGNRVLPAATRASTVGNSWEYYYEAIKGGTSSGTEPNWFGGTTGPGAQAPDPSSPWTQQTKYAKYTVVRSATRYDVFFLCTTAGTSKSGSEPTWNLTIGGTTQEGPDTLEWTTYSTEAYFIADGGTLASPGTGVVWACRLAAGIFAQTRFSLRRVAITGAVNAGLHIQATAANSVIHKANANGFSAYDLEVRKCGGGIVTRADEVNAGVVANARITTRGPANDKSFGIADRGFLGNRYIGVYVDECGGPVLDQTSPANSGALMGVSATATCGAAINNSSQGYGLFGGFLAAGFATGSSFTGANGPHDWRDVWAIARDGAGDPIHEAKLYAAPYVMSFKSYDDGNFCGVGYDFPGAGLTGWWSLFYATPGFTALAWSGTNAEDGPGSVVGGGYAFAYPGLLLGSPATMIASAVAKPVAGTWRQGDLVFNAMASSGDPSFWQCVSVAPLDFLDGPALP